MMEDLRKHRTTCCFIKLLPWKWGYLRRWKAFHSWKPYLYLLIYTIIVTTLRLYRFEGKRRGKMGKKNLAPYWTKPHPLPAWILTDTISPNCKKVCFSSSSVILRSKLPTNICNAKRGSKTPYKTAITEVLGLFNLQWYCSHHTLVELYLLGRYMLGLGILLSKKYFR